MSQIIQVITREFVSLAKTTHETPCLKLQAKQMKIRQRLDHIHNLAETMAELSQNARK